MPGQPTTVAVVPVTDLSVTDLADDPHVVHHERLRGTDGVVTDWPDWVPRPVIEALARSGVSAPWVHQVTAAAAAHAGSPVAIATGTASGKSLGYLLPVLAATAGGSAPSLPARRQETLDPLLSLLARGRPTALYLAPTKALAHDQLRACRALGVAGWRITGLDGDSEPGERDFARDHAGYVLTNPDMLHYSVLPRHREWASLLRGLTYVVVDEAHRYRGVFGAHVAGVLARLRRLARSYGADPVFITASATAPSPGRSAAALLGLPEAELVVVDDDTSAHPARDLLIWQPDDTGAGPDADDCTAALLARLVEQGRQTLAFTGSRRGAERIAATARRLAPEQRIGCYRGGYLAADRRRIEQALQSGELRGLACTNALELGIDVSGVDAVLVSGFPGTRAALWQQLGRAGRGTADALGVLLTRAHPLDRFLVEHPDLLHAPVEDVALHPANPYVLGPQLVAAAQELPLTVADADVFGPSMPALAARLEAEGALRRRPGGWYFGGESRAVDQIPLRTGGGPTVEVLETGTGRVIETMDALDADTTVHPGAVFVHQGESYLVQSFDHQLGEATVRAAEVGFVTQPRRRVEATVVATRHQRASGAGRAGLGEVEIHSQVTGYLRRDAMTGAVWDQTPLDLPVRVLRTDAVWLTLDPVTIDDDISRTALAGGLHAVEHLLVNLLALFVPSDPWDVGGVSVTDHPDTDRLTVIVHDARSRGAGFAERAYAVVDDWLAAARHRVSSCTCASGCPACILSARCSVPQQPLDKAVAGLLLERMTQRSTS